MMHQNSCMSMKFIQHFNVLVPVFIIHQPTCAFIDVGESKMETHHKTNYHNHKKDTTEQDARAHLKRFHKNQGIIIH